MTKKAVHTMNPKCSTNGRTEADKYPGQIAAGSDSMGTLAMSPLLTFLLLLRLECSGAGVSSVMVAMTRYKALLYNLKSHAYMLYTIKNNE